MSEVSQDSSLSKYIAQAGVCSRRQAPELIASGRVTVNGVRITNSAHKLLQGDIVKIGNRVIRQAAKVYILLNKPKDYITTVSDEKGRKTVLDLVRSATKAKIFPVGRLDRHTTGLLLFTNDGDLANKVSHPRYGAQKTYNVVLDKPLQPKDAQKIRKGVKLEDGIVKVDNLVSVFNKQRFQGRAKITLHSGKYRVIRRLFEYLGYKVIKLDRTAYAGLVKKGLPVGRWRKLTPQELAMLKGIKK
ncbi:rRNA pseudouridine synthase [Candidatus Dependentiae bacterium]|nr:rRNA pseudouridine synthase [Candidatus Dependentiae bacterium]